VGEPTAEKKEAFKMKYKKEGSLALQPDNQIKPQPKTIAAIPAYNEEKHIEEIVSKTLHYVDQVIVVDDGSVDRTGERARGAGAEVVTHDKNSGKGVAINTAFKAAREINPNAMVLLDADGQHSPEEIPSLLDPVLNNQADMVVGSRFLKNNHIITKWPFMLGSNSTQYHRHNLRLSGIKLTDTLEIRLPLQEEGMSISMEIIIKARKLGLRMCEVPITCLYIEGSSTLNPVVHGLSVAMATVVQRVKCMGVSGDGTENASNGEFHPVKVYNRVKDDGPQRNRFRRRIRNAVHGRQIRPQGNRSAD
jgi:hypothetical protein